MEMKVGWTNSQCSQPIILPCPLSSHKLPSSIYLHRPSNLYSSCKSNQIPNRICCNAKLDANPHEDFCKRVQELEENSDRDEFIRGSIERKANRVDIPLSIRIIKRKQQWEESFTFRDLAKDYTNTSVKKAFSSMVFMIRELQNYRLHVREILYSEDLHDIINRVQRDMHASFVWLFQQVFSKTPTLMVYLMILLANFTVYSMVDPPAIAATPLGIVSYANTKETMSVSITEQQSKFDSYTIGSGRTVNLSSVRYVPSEEVLKSFPSFGNADELIIREEEVSLWNSMVEEASKMQLRDDIQFVSPVSVVLEKDGYFEYFKTELFYQIGLSQDPYSPLLLSNYAQFLYLVAHQYDRAEECFKRAVEVEPTDASALSHYANFLWSVRNDLWGAEERYQQAVAAEPDNPYHASRYASFLWNTGGEDTCFPLNTSYNNSKA